MLYILHTIHLFANTDRDQVISGEEESSKVTKPERDASLLPL